MKKYLVHPLALSTTVFILSPVHSAKVLVGELDVIFIGCYLISQLFYLAEEFFITVKFRKVLPLAVASTDADINLETEIQNKIQRVYRITTGILAGLLIMGTVLYRFWT